MSDIRDLMNSRSQRMTGLTQLRSEQAQRETSTIDTSVFLSVDSITVEDKIQVRVGRLNAAKVESYAEALKAGAEFPPVDVFRDGDVAYLADGFHRLAAHIAAGKTEISAVVRPGGYDAAYEYAEEANLAHGLELSMADKKNIFRRRIKRGYWDNSKESARQIARAFGVNASTITRWRQELESGATPDEGVANATLAEEYEKPQTALTRKKGGRKPAKKRDPNPRQYKQRALKSLRTAADAFAELEELGAAEYLMQLADEWAAEWGL